jgi:hypothetical protein
MSYYNRYAAFMADGEVSVKVPFIKISKSSSDINLIYNRRTMRCDTLSYKYYGDPNYAWLILQANPQYKGYEFSIPDGASFRIPYPLDSAIQRYESGITRWKNEHES